MRILLLLLITGCATQSHTPPRGLVAICLYSEANYLDIEVNAIHNDPMCLEAMSAWRDSI